MLGPPGAGGSVAPCLASQTNIHQMHNMYSEGSMRKLPNFDQRCTYEENHPLCSAGLILLA